MFLVFPFSLCTVYQWVYTLSSIFLNKFQKDTQDHIIKSFIIGIFLNSWYDMYIKRHTYIEIRREWKE